MLIHTIIYMFSTESIGAQFSYLNRLRKYRKALNKMEYAPFAQSDIVMQTFFGSRDIFCEKCNKQLTRPSHVKSKNSEEYFPNYYCKRCIKGVSEFKPASSFMRMYQIDGFRFIIFTM